jgi:hypothetical protein
MLNLLGMPNQPALASRCGSRPETNVLRISVTYPATPRKQPPPPPPPPVCCQAEIDATDSTAQDMLQDSDSEGEEDDEGEGEDSWDLDDDSASRCRLFNCMIQSSPVLDPDYFQRFQTTTRVATAQRSEGNRRIGGMKTQTSTVKIWNVRLNLSVPRVGDPSLTVYVI